MTSGKNIKKMIGTDVGNKWGNKANNKPLLEYNLQFLGVKYIGLIMEHLNIILILISIYLNIIQTEVVGLEENLHHIIIKEDDYNMDFLLDIVIPKDEIKKIDLEEQLVEWDGMLFSQEPARFISKNLVFEKLTNLKYYSDILGKNLDEQKYSAFIYKGNELSELEFLANNFQGDFIRNSLLIFLEKIVRLSSFYLFLLREDEKIKERYEIENEEEFCKILQESLSWIKPKDIVILRLL